MFGGTTNDGIKAFLGSGWSGKLIGGEKCGKGWCGGCVGGT